jgi:hypothetical protein
MFANGRGGWKQTIQEALLRDQATAINGAPNGYLISAAHNLHRQHDAALQAFSNARSSRATTQGLRHPEPMFLLSSVAGRSTRFSGTQLAVSRTFCFALLYAVIYAGLEEVDSAFEWLERARATDNLWCAILAKDRQVDILRSDLRFEALMNRCDFELNSDRVE